jgi:hypothetical protein
MKPLWYALRSLAGQFLIEWAMAVLPGESKLNFAKAILLFLEAEAAASKAKGAKTH